jgi:hypothetical protein
VPHCCCNALLILVLLLLLSHRFFCNAEGEPLTEDEKFGLGLPGAELSVCVTPDEAARESGAFQLDQIDLFEWIRVDPNGQEVRQTAIEDGQTPDPLTIMECNEEGCSFVSILQASFFQGTLPTPAPSESPTQFPTTMAPTVSPPPPGFDGLVEGHCTDNAGNKYDYYQATNYEGSHTQCPGQCSTLSSLLSSFTEEVRAYEHDGIGCQCLVDGSVDRNLAGYTHTKAAGVSAISEVYSFQEQEGVRCYKYSVGSVEEQSNPTPTTFGSLTSLGSSGAYCTDSAGLRTDVVSIYDQRNQLFGYNSMSCLDICETLFGSGFLGVTIFRDESVPAPEGAPYTGTGDFQCQCHVLLDEATDTRIAYAQSYPFPAGQGFASADASGNGNSVAGVSNTPSPGSWCFGYAPRNLNFAGEGYCTDNDGTLYDSYSPSGGGGIITDCPDQCETLASLYGNATYPEAVRGLEYDGIGCRCLVDGGFGDRGFAGFTYYDWGAAAGETSAISPIISIAPASGVSCFQHQSEMYRSTLSYSGSLSTVGSGYCTDNAGAEPGAVSLFDVNQRTGSDPYSCLSLCESVFGTSMIGFTIIREPAVQAPAPGGAFQVPYSGLGNYQCRCHMVLNGMTDPRIAAGQAYNYPSGQGYANEVTLNPVGGANGGATAVSASSYSDSSKTCYTYGPPGLSWQGEGRCTDGDSGNQYDYYIAANTNAGNFDDCPDRCDGLALQLDGLQDSVRGFESNGPNCHCLVDSGFGDRGVTGFTFVVASGVSAISPIMNFTPEAGWTCYASVYGRYRDYSSYTSSLSYLGAGSCADSVGAATDLIALYDVEQRKSVDSYKCLNLCKSIVGGPNLMGITLLLQPTASVPTAPYTGLGNYQCQCHVNLSGPSDPKIVSAQSYAYRTGQGYSYAVSSATGTAVNLVVSSSGSMCYRYTGGRRELEEGTVGADHYLALPPANNDLAAEREAAGISYKQPQGVVVTSDSRPRQQFPTGEPGQEQQLRRNLQGTTTIGGAGQATLKFARRTYRRNLITGEEGWTTKNVKEKRRLQVGGGSAFNLDLQVQLVDFNNRYYARRRSSASTQYSLPAMMLFTSLATVAVILGSLF